jgi:1-deoxy-D-xylulose-5-phosphate reductoisomerase
MVRNSEADIVLCAIVGLEGLFPAIESLRNGKTLALASKEIIVAAGQHIIDIAKKHKAMIIPVDSEHSAIFQCLEGKNKNELKRVILTASGGPFRKMSPSRISQASPGSALLHPTWKMGEKISVDSATLMNKALEMVEAKWLFALAPGQISVVIHPQSIIHSMVEFIDGAIFAQMSPPDMRLAIQYSFTYPKRVKGNLKNFDFAKFAKLEFEVPDRKKFPSLDFAEEAIKKGGTLPSVMNAANEVAVDKFLKSEIKIPDIWKIIERAMSSHKIIRDPSLEEILAADAETRRIILENYS